MVAGTARGRRLEAPAGRDTRPTLDRVREAVFNALVSLEIVDGATVLDLFAGSGAMGIEALSRGAAHCTFVDSDRAAAVVIDRNLQTTGLAERADVVVASAVDWAIGPGASARFDLVVCDPPYDTDDTRWAQTFAAIAPLTRRADGSPGVVVVESDRSVPVPARWHPLREKAYGGTIVSVLQPPDDHRTAGRRADTGA